MSADYNTYILLWAVPRGHLLWLEFRFRFWFWFWNVCSKAASSGINVTQGSITRNDVELSLFRYIEHIYSLGWEKRCQKLGSFTCRQVNLGSRDIRSPHGDAPVPISQTGCLRTKDTVASRGDVTDRQLTWEAGTPRPQMETTASASQRPPRANR